MRRVIGISGKARSGKDHLALRINQKLGMNRVGFADQVKEAACFFLPWREGGTIGRLDRQTIEEWKVKEDVPEGWDQNMRAALITIGDRMREICPTAWIDSVLHVRTDDIIVPDVRYKNELSAIDLMPNKLLIRVFAPNMHGAGAMSDNRSETELDCIDELCRVTKMAKAAQGQCALYGTRHGSHYDAVVINDGSIEDFNACADFIASAIMAAAVLTNAFGERRDSEELLFVSSQHLGVLA